MANSVEKRERQARRRRWLWPLWLLLLIPIFYVIIQIVIIVMPRMRTEVAIQETMTEALETDGVVSLQSMTVTKPSAAPGVLYYTVAQGQRVSKGSEIAKVFGSDAAAAAMASLDRVNAEIAMLEDAQNNMDEGGDVEAVLKQIQDGLNRYMTSLDTQDYTGIGESRDTIAMGTNRLQVATGGAPDLTAHMEALKAQKQQYEARAVASGQLEAPETGYFMPSSQQDRIGVPYETLEKMTAGQLEKTLQNPPRFYGEDVVGHIFTDYKWYYFTSVSEKDAERFAKGDKLQIAFPDHDIEPLPVVVDSLEPDAAGGRVKVVFACEYINPEVMGLRVENARIIFRTEKGLRIDKDALRVIEGERYVYVKFGNQVYRRKISILLEDENYMLISPQYKEGVNEVSLYDDVIVDSGGKELYDKKIL